MKKSHENYSARTFYPYEDYFHPYQHELQLLTGNHPRCTYILCKDRQPSTLLSLNTIIISLLSIESCLNVFEIQSRNSYIRYQYMLLRWNFLSCAFFHTYFLKVYKNLLIYISIPIIKIKIHARVKIIIAICHKWIFTCYLSIWNIQRNGTGPTRIASRGRWTTKYTITSRNAGENIFPSLHIIIAMSFFICFNIFSFNILQYNSLKNKLSSINALQTSFCKYLHIANCSNRYKKMGIMAIHALYLAIIDVYTQRNVWCDAI